MGMESCPGNPEVVYVTCPTCGGTGEGDGGSDGKSCRNCGGSGQIIVS